MQRPVKCGHCTFPGSINILFFCHFCLFPSVFYIFCVDPSFDFPSPDFELAADFPFFSPSGLPTDLFPVGVPLYPLFFLHPQNFISGPPNFCYVVSVFPLQSRNSHIPDLQNLQNWDDTAMDETLIRTPVIICLCPGKRSPTGRSRTAIGYPAPLRRQRPKADAILGFKVPGKNPKNSVLGSEPVGMSASGKRSHSTDADARSGFESIPI